MGWLGRVSQKTAARALGATVELTLWLVPSATARIAAPLVALRRGCSSIILEEDDELGYRMLRPSSAASGTAPSTTPTPADLAKAHGPLLAEHPELFQQAIARRCYCDGGHRWDEQYGA